MDVPTEWPWHLCLGCQRLAPARCQKHAGGSADETPYQTLTRWGSVELVVRQDDADEFRGLLRAEARADRLHVRTYAAVVRGDLCYVIAELSDYSLSEEDQAERLRAAMEGFSWGEM
jgi:hypothetical protein